jgi:phage shock protein C
MDKIHDSFRDGGLVRPSQGRVLGGVCAGLGRRFGIDPWPARLLFVLILLVLPGSQFLIYPILWVLMPAQQTAPQAFQPSAPNQPNQPTQPTTPTQPTPLSTSSPTITMPGA